MLFERAQNFLEQAVDVLHHVVVPKSQDQVSHRSQNSGSICVFRSASCMLSAIKLDDETRLGTTKIRDVTINGNLSLEFQAAQSPIAQVKPKHTLGIRLIAAKSLGGAYLPIHRRNPLTPTLSPAGRGSSLPERRRSDPNRQRRCPVADIKIGEMEREIRSELDTGSGALLPLPAGERVGVRGFGSTLFDAIRISSRTASV